MPRNAQAAEAAYRQAIALHEKLAQDFPREPLYQHDLADDLNNLGVFLRERHRLAKGANQNRGDPAIS